MRNICFLLVTLALSGNLYAQGKMVAGFGRQVFYTAAMEPYMEVYLQLDGSSLTYLPVEEKLKSAVLEVIIIASEGDEVHYHDKYRIPTDQYALPDSMYKNLFEMKRFSLKPGTIGLEMILRDVNGNNEMTIRDTIVVDAKPNELLMNDIQFIEVYQKTVEQNIFSKAGYDLLPYNGDVYDENMDRLIFYTEIYNADARLGDKGKYLLTYYLEDTVSGRQLQEFTVGKREVAAKLRPVLAEINIASLTAGDYHLVVEMRDSTNKFVARKKAFFHKDNEYVQMREEDFKTIAIENTFVYNFNNTDSLMEHIRSLKPIAGEIEYQFAKNVIRNGDATMMKRYLYSFWNKRNNKDPYGDFLAYKKQVAAVEQSFGTPINPGYNTDRGRVYLKYGPPSARNKQYNEPSAYPYEIWQYEQIKAQSNIRFVFYNPDLASNNFMLLHSDYRGEINNRQWEMIIHKRNNSSNIDQNEPGDYYGGWSRDLYNQPR